MSDRTLRIFVASVVVALSLYHWFFLQPKLTALFGPESWMSDYYLCYEAGHGNFAAVTPTNASGLDGRNRIIYPHTVAFIWWPWTKLGTFQETAPYYYAFLVLCYALLSLKLCEVKYGWIVAIIGIRFLWWSLDFGNVYPFLALLTVYALPTILAALVKPVCLIVPLVRLGRGILEHHSRWKDASTNLGLDSPCPDYVLHPSEEAGAG
jgi:hypothetical protein